VIACAVVLAAAAITTACFRPPAPRPALPATSTAAATPTAAMPTATMQAHGFTFSFDVVPDKVGTNIINMYARTPDGKEATIKDWRVTCSLSGAPPITAATAAITPGHAVAEIELLTAGVWRFSFTLRVSDTDEEQLYADVRIS